MQIGKLIISWDRAPRITSEEIKTINQKYEEGLRSGKQLILGTLPARSGTMWLCDIFDAHRNATGITERNFEVESFYRYVKYNNLPIDTTGVIALIKRGIIKDWEKGDIALVFSPFFSHGISELDKELSPKKIIFAITEPRFTVQSMFNKGFFKHTLLRSNNNLALGPQPTFLTSWSYLFGRVVPNGEFYNQWLKLTQIGKISWWGNKMIVDIWEQLKNVSENKIFFFDLKEADQNYKYYQKLVKMFGLSPILSEKKFLSIKWKRVKKSHNKEHLWSKEETEEFNHYTKEWHSIYSEIINKKGSF